MMWPLDALGLVPERGLAGDMDVDSLRVIVIPEGLQVSLAAQAIDLPKVDG